MVLAVTCHTGNLFSQKPLRVANASMRTAFCAVGVAGRNHAQRRNRASDPPLWRVA